MGYRSEVVLVVGKEVLPQFLVTMAKSSEARSMCYKHADQYDKDYCGDGAAFFVWSYIKWYEGDEAIDAITDFMDWCDGEKITVEEGEYDADDYYRFVRLGESKDDNVVRGYGFDHVNIEQNITF